MFFCEFCEIFKSNLFTEHLRKTASKGWVLGSLLFEIFKCDLWTTLEEIDFSIHADDNASVASEASPENVVKSLERCFVSWFKWSNEG